MGRYLSPSGLDEDDEVIYIRIRNCWIGNGLVAGFFSFLTGPLVGSSVTHWWAEIETRKAYYCAQFDGDKDLALTKHSSRSEVEEQGKSVVGSRGESKDITTRDYSSVSGWKMRNIIDFIRNSDSNYNLMTNNCQHFVLKLFQAVTNTDWKIQGGLLFGGGTSIWRGTSIWKF